MTAAHAEEDASKAGAEATQGSAEIFLVPRKCRRDRVNYREVASQHGSKMFKSRMYRRSILRRVRLRQMARKRGS